jgi:hypothetical protein
MKVKYYHLFSSTERIHNQYGIIKDNIFVSEKVIIPYWVINTWIEQCLDVKFEEISEEEYLQWRMEL